MDMDVSSLTEKAKQYLDRLCSLTPDRRVGSPANRAATDFFAATIKSFGFDVESPAFECMDWQGEGSTISVQGRTWHAQVSPYSLGARVKAPLRIASAAAALEALDLAGKILLLSGELTREQFLPKNFPFFQVEEQQRIIQQLEAKRPLAIITATRRNPEMAGALYPFPVFEDGDFDIPSVFITEEQGAQLAEQEGEDVSVEIESQRVPAHACNVVARKGRNGKDRVVLFAHIDAKAGTPGALDNGTGIVTLLLVGRLLKGYTGEKMIEIVALNGEDYYNNPGEQLYLKQNAGKFQEIQLGINIDGMGYCRGKTAFSVYDCPADLRNLIGQVFAEEEFLEGEPWFQGDHALFLMHGRPALVLTSELVNELMTEIVHTSQDTPDLVDSGKVARAALALHRLLTGL
jgi:aminopeptidase YwaD